MNITPREAVIIVFAGSAGLFVGIGVKWAVNTAWKIIERAIYGKDK